MTAETTLKLVRELSEGATIRPAPKRLKVGSLMSEVRGPKRAAVAYEELHPTVIGSGPMRASGYKQRSDQAGWGGGRPRQEKKDFLQLAAEKADQGSTESRPTHLPEAA